MSQRFANSHSLTCLWDTVWDVSKMHLRCIYAGWDITPKVHNKDIPGQPLVNPFDFYTSKLSKFVDHYLQPRAKALPSYVKSTTEFTSKIENVKETSKDSILVTLGIKPFYTNIRNHEVIEIVKEALQKQAKKPIATWVTNSNMSNYQIFVFYINPDQLSI